MNKILHNFTLKNNKLYGLFLCMEFNCLKATEPLRGDSLLSTTRSPGVPGTHLIYLRRMKAMKAILKKTETFQISYGFPALKIY